MFILHKLCANVKLGFKISCPRIVLSGEIFDINCEINELPVFKSP